MQNLRDLIIDSRFFPVANFFYGHFKSLKKEIVDQELAADPLSGSEFETGEIELKSTDIRAYAEERLIGSLATFPDSFYQVHPVACCQLVLLDLLNRYRFYDDRNALKRSEELISALLENCVVANNVLLARYDKNYWAFGIPRYKMKAPWHSGMAQGQLLSALVKLYECTGSSHWLDHARRVAPSFDLIYKDNPNCWITAVDQRRCLWIAEFPRPNGFSFTLNGMIFGLIGLYDFARVTGDLRSAELFCGGVHTIERYIDKYRNEGQCSIYSRKPISFNEGYHTVHCGQLDFLAKVTGSLRLKKAAEQFIEDFPAKKPPPL